MSPDLETRVRGANPVRDDQLEQLFGSDASSRLLREIRDRRVAPMRTSETDQQFETPTPTESPWWRRGWIAALSAAAVVLVIIGVVALLQSGDDPPVGAEAPVTTSAQATTAPEAATTIAPETVDPISVVMSSIDAYNSGDIEAWLGHFTEDAAIFGVSRVTAAAEYAKWLAAGSQFAISRPCSEDGLGSDGHPVIACGIDETNAFHGAGGITNSLAVAFTVSEDGISLATPGDFGWANWSRFNSRFWLWLEQAHPDVLDEIGLADGPLGTDDSSQRMPQTAEAMAIALQYVDEFVAQSDEYPIVVEE